jgi:hypothetical protein
MYRAANLTPLTAKSAKLTTLADKGENLLSLSEFLGQEFAFKIQNLLPLADARLEKVGGFTNFISNGSSALGRAEKLGDYVVYSQGKNIYVNDGTSDTLVTTFVNADVTTLVNFGWYWFACTGKDKIRRISITLNYDNVVTAFQVGETITGATSGATATILEKTGSVLTLSNIEGAFQDNETIDGDRGGEALVDGTITPISTEIINSPKAKVLFVFGSRMYSGNLEGAESEVRSAQEYTGSNPPFDDWYLTINYNTETSPFTVGEKLTGGTSGATATIATVEDNGTSGTLGLMNIKGDFQSGETITDTAGGSATSASVVTDDPLLVTDPFQFTYAAAGAVNDIISLGAQVVILYESGEAGIRTETINIDTFGARLKLIKDFERQGLGGLKALSTKFGIFYANTNGIFQMVSGGNTAQPFSKSENKISALFSKEFTASLDFSDAALFHDETRNLLYIACKEDAQFNNIVLVYNTETNAFTRIVGLYVNDFFTDNTDIFATSSIEGKVYKLFDGNDFGGTSIKVQYIQELTQGEVINLNRLREVYAKGKLHPDSVVTISFDIYDKNGILNSDFKSLTWTLTGGSINNLGIGQQGIGSGIAGVSGKAPQKFESWFHRRLQIYEYSRIILKIEEESSLPLELNWVSLITEAMGRNKNYTY